MNWNQLAAVIRKRPAYYWRGDRQVAAVLSWWLAVM
jgi:hypothetical protein